MTSSTDLLENLPIAIYMTDADGRITFFNQAAAELWGYRPEIGSARWCGSLRLFSPTGEPMAHDESPMAVAIRQGQPVRGVAAIAERPDGTRFRFQPYPTPLHDVAGRVTGAINLLVDITSQHEWETGSQRLAAIVASSDDAIISKSLDGIIATWNEAAARIFGYEADEMIGRPITTIIPRELHGEEKDILARLQRGERVDHYETVRVARDGRRVEVSLTVSPLHDRLGRVVGASKVARDITERKRAESLQRTLMNELNHRVKNTLATVQAIANQSLSRSTGPEEFALAFTGRVHALAKAHAVLTHANLEGADLTELIREQVILGRDNDTISTSGPLLVLDPNSAMHLALVLHELATNARKYGALSVPDGRLSVTWELRTSTGRDLLLQWKESNGPTVHAPSRRGFGTTLIEQTVKNHGGDAVIRYGADGVTCLITMPITVAASGAATAVAQRAAAESEEVGSRHDSLYGKRILIVEDEPLVAMDMAASLVAAGCEVAGPAGNLRDAKRLVADADFDAALLDANLAGSPVDELAAALARLEIPFAFATGYGQESLPSGFRDAILLDKPFSPSQLIAVVRRLLDRAENVVTLRRPKPGQR